MNFEHIGYGRRLSTMVKTDLRRMFTQPLVYIMVGACLVMPILILVMTTMIDGTVSVDPQTGKETVMEGFDNTWQIIGSISTDSAAGMEMDMMSMCNINLLYFFLAVPVCLFTAADFRSGYAKNLFTTRAGKAEYVVSKTVVSLLWGVLMLAAFFVGTVAGGAISGLPFELGQAGVQGLALCMAGKAGLLAVFVPVYLLWSVAAKQKSWLSILGSMMVGMLFFMMIPALTPLDSTPVQAAICLGAGTLLSIGLGIVSNVILKKTALV